MNKQLLIIGFVWPEPKSSAAGSRMMQLISFFQTQGYHITFASACAKSDNAFDIETLGITKKTIQLNDSSFDDFIIELQPSVVIFDRFMTEEQFGWRVAEQLPNAMRILDTEDLHFLRKGREAAYRKHEEFSNVHLFNDFAKREIASMYRCDLSLIISKAEMQLLENRFQMPKQLLFYLPFLVEPISEVTQQQLPSFENRDHFVTIGNFIHPPNYDALLYLKETIWPKIKQKLPKAELHNYGAYGAQKVEQLHNQKEGFLIKGRADNANTVIGSAKVLLAPLRFGAGLKGKLFDAMQNGTPYLTSKIGAEGILDADFLDPVVADHPDTFVDYAVNCYTDKDLWIKLQQNGFKILNENFDKSIYETAFSKRLESLIQNLQQERALNFTGQMLMHHTMQGTKYMSKWIELKNL